VATGGVLRVALSRPMHHAHSPTLANAIAGPSRLPLPATAAPAPVLRQFVISVRSAHQYTRGELKRILPTLSDLGLKSGDHGGSEIRRRQHGWASWLMYPACQSPSPCPEGWTRR
jgi:hypothetical protein